MRHLSARWLWYSSTTDLITTKGSPAAKASSKEGNEDTLWVVSRRPHENTKVLAQKSYGWEAGADASRVELGIRGNKWQATEVLNTIRLLCLMQKVKAKQWKDESRDMCQPEQRDGEMLWTGMCPAGVCLPRLGKNVAANVGKLWANFWLSALWERKEDSVLWMEGRTNHIEPETTCVGRGLQGRRWVSFRALIGTQFMLSREPCQGRSQQLSLDTQISSEISKPQKNR